jgi:alpha-glucoside transport system substrate-binding protein
MFKDTPQARALMQYLVTPEAQAIWTRRGGAISPNRQVGTDAYPDPMAAKAAQIMTSASTVRFDASDLMPEGMNNAFMRGILDYVNDPGRLTEILGTLDRTQADVYPH